MRKPSICTSEKKIAIKRNLKLKIRTSDGKRLYAHDYIHNAQEITLPFDKKEAKIYVELLTFHFNKDTWLVSMILNQSSRELVLKFYRQLFKDGHTLLLESCKKVIETFPYSRELYEFNIDYSVIDTDVLVSKFFKYMETGLETIFIPPFFDKLVILCSNFDIIIGWNYCFRFMDIRDLEKYLNIYHPSINITEIEVLVNSTKNTILDIIIYTKYIIKIRLSDENFTSKKQ